MRMLARACAVLALVALAACSEEALKAGDDAAVAAAGDDAAVVAVGNDASTPSPDGGGALDSGGIDPGHPDGGQTLDAGSAHRTPIRPAYRGSVNGASEMTFVGQNIDLYLGTAPRATVDAIKSHQRTKALYLFNLISVYSADPHYDRVDQEDLWWRDSEGHTIQHMAWGWRLVDIRKPAWRQLIKDVLTEQLQSYDGAVFDDAKILYLTDVTGEPVGYTHQVFYDAMQQVVQEVASAFPGKYFSVNGYRRSSQFSGMHYLDSASNLMFGDFTYRDGDGDMFVGRSALRTEMQDFVKVTSDLGKEAIFTDFGMSVDRFTREFCFANYLLVAHPNAYYFFSSADVPGAEYYPEYELDIGLPTGPFTETGDGLLVREFEKGKVISNPTAEPVSTQVGSMEKVVLRGGGPVNAPGTLEWQAVSGTVELDTEDALILRQPGL
ncbi:MAG: hypothetical protein HY901_21960 [Deltaproteobacteria bacterium]|nr:hypothetical protein [Deltaproteobacteria bacterium]